MEIYVDKDSSGETYPLEDGKRTTWEALREKYPHVTFRVVTLFAPEQLGGDPVDELPV